MTLLVQIRYKDQQWVEAMFFRTLPEPIWVDESGKVHRLISIPHWSSSDENSQRTSK